MKTSKLYQSLALLSAHELIRLSKVLEADRNGPPTQVNALLMLLIDVIRGRKALADDPKEIWHEVSGGIAWHHGRFRKMCSAALQVIEQFMSVEFFLQDRLLESCTRLLALSSRPMHAVYKTHLSRIQTQLDREKERAGDYFYYNYKVQQNMYQVRQSNLQRFMVSNIDDIVGNLDAFYIIEKLRYYCEILSRRTFVKHEYSKKLLEEIIDLIRDGHFDDIPPIKIYYQIVLSHREPDLEHHYFELKQLLQTYGSTFPAWQLKEIYTSTLNYCNRKINQGKLHFLAESLDTYKELLRKELIMETGYLSQWTYKNVVVLALRLGDFEWAWKFIKTYQDRISEPYRRNAVSYNLAQFYFYQGNYDQVLSLLQEVEYEDITYNLGAKTMLLATYYEMKEWEPLFALAESFKVYIHRKKNLMPEARRRSYLNLIRFTLKLSRVTDWKSNKIIKIAEALDSLKEEVASENWIREKIMERRPSQVTVNNMQL